MSKDQAFHRIIWAVDPFAEDLDLQKSLPQILNALNRGAVSIEPVSLIYGGETEREAKKKVENMVKKFQLKGATTPTVLIQQDLSLSGAVRRLIDHAKKTSANLIAVGTLARKGATQFLMGSFAETLVLHSDVPTLIVSPKTKPLKQIEEIIFPTDLSEKSITAFKSVLVLAKEVGARVLLFHRARSLPPSMQETAQFVEAGKKIGVTVQIQVQKDGPETLASILALAKKADSTLIAMVSRSGNENSPVLGSTTRQVIRYAQHPVWVLHP